MLALTHRAHLFAHTKCTRGTHLGSTSPDISKRKEHFSRTTWQRSQCAGHRGRLCFSGGTLTTLDTLPTRTMLPLQRTSNSTTTQLASGSRTPVTVSSYLPMCRRRSLTHPSPQYADRMQLSMLTSPARWWQDGGKMVKGVGAGWLAHCCVMVASTLHC
jgi:hypothetical protein